MQMCLPITKGLIALRKSHPAFRMGDADMVRKHLEFIPVEGSNLIAYRLKDHANGDSWQEIIVALNATYHTSQAIHRGWQVHRCLPGWSD